MGCGGQTCTRKHLQRFWQGQSGPDRGCVPLRRVPGTTPALSWRCLFFEIRTRKGGFGRIASKAAKKSPLLAGPPTPLHMVGGWQADDSGRCCGSCTRMPACCNLAHCLPENTQMRVQ